MSNVHPAAATGYAGAAATYVGGRPDYPAPLAEWLRQTLQLGPGSIALDLGAGTGKFTPMLVATGADVIAVEPVAEMRAALAARCPQVQALDGTAQAIPLADASVDAIVCAQSFHWFATPMALAEIARVLRPGGSLGLVWNVRDKAVPWVAALSVITDAYEDDAPRYGSGAWQSLFPAPGFEALPAQHWPHAHVGNSEAVLVDRTLSTSFIAALPPATRQEVAARVRALIAATPELAHDPVSFPYRTETYAFRKRADATPIPLETALKGQYN